MFSRCSFLHKWWNIASPYPISLPVLYFSTTSVCETHLEPQLFLERERAAILAEAKTDDLISEAPKPALDQSGEWQETSGEIQWVASETNDNQPEKKEEEEEELDLNKGRARSCFDLRPVLSGGADMLSGVLQLCSTQANTWRTASLPPTPPCCWAACARAVR